MVVASTASADVLMPLRNAKRAGLHVPALQEPPPQS
jgi:hypothetical protein